MLSKKHSYWQSFRTSLSKMKSYSQLKAKLIEISCYFSPKPERATIKSRNKYWNKRLKFKANWNFINKARKTFWRAWKIFLSIQPLFSNFKNHSTKRINSLTPYFNSEYRSQRSITWKKAFLHTIKILKS